MKKAFLFSLVSLIALVNLAASFNFLNFFSSFSCGTAFASEVIGSVNDVIPRSWANRGGQNNGLGKGAEIFLADVLGTDKLGKLDVIFADGTAIALGADSEITVSDYVMNGADSNFMAEIGKGAARVVTGTLVKRNPSGFNLKTSRGIIGIRGTTLAIVTDGKGNELISVLDIGESLHVTVIDRRTGKRVKVDTSNYSVYFERGKGPAVLQNTQQLNMLLDKVFTPDSPPNITDLVMREANREFIKQKPARDSYYDAVTDNSGNNGDSDGGAGGGSGNPGGNAGGGNDSGDDDGGDDD